MLPLNTLAEQVLSLTFINPMGQRHFTSGGGLHRFDLLVKPWGSPMHTPPSRPRHRDRNQQPSSDATRRV